MGTTINPVNNAFPWPGLRGFVAKHEDIFPKNSKAVFSLEIPKEGSKGTEDQKVKITFAHPIDANGVKIYGSTRSTIGIVSECKLDLENNSGRVTLPQFNSRVELNKEECSIDTPLHSHPDIYTFTEEALFFFQDVLDRFIGGEDERIQEALRQMALKKRSL